MITTEQLSEIKQYSFDLGWFIEANDNSVLFENDNAIVEVTAEFETNSDGNIELLFRTHTELFDHKHLFVEEYSFESLKSILEKHSDQKVAAI